MKSMGGWWLLLSLLLVPGLAPARPVPEAADAAPETHVRGEFRFQVAPPPAFVQVREVPATWANASPDDRWRNWLVDSQFDLRKGGYVDYTDLAYEATTSALVGSAARHSIEFSPLYQTLTLHRVQLRRDGTWQDRLDPEKISLARREAGFEEDLSDGVVTALVVLEDVQPGDVVRVSYTIDGNNPVMAGSVANVFNMAWNAPILVRGGRVLFDRDDRVSIRQEGIDLDIKPRKVDGGLEVAFERRDVAAIIAPDDSPEWHAMYPRIQVARERSWGDVVAWAEPLYPPVSALPDELEQRLAQWRALDGPFRQAGAVLQAMQEEIRYFGVEMGDNTHRPNPPGLVWARRYGDCKDKAYLSVLLLRRLGLDAEPALVSTRIGRRLDRQLPAATAFNHVIVRLRIDGKSYWLDPTLTGQRGDVRALDVSEYGLALPIAAGADALVKIDAPAQAASGIEIVERFTPGSDGASAELRVQTTYRGERANLLRRQLQRRRLDRMAEDFAEYYRKRYGALEVATPLAMAEDAEKNTLTLSEHYRLPEALSQVGNERTLESYAESVSGYAVLPSVIERTAPIALARPASVRHEVRVALPEGWVLSNLPGEVTAGGGPATYKRTLAQQDGEVRLVHEFKNALDHVEGEQVPEYIGGVREIRDHLGLRLVFGLPAPIKSSERDQRLRDLLRGALEPTPNPTPRQD